MVDLVLAGDNAIVVGIVAAGLPREQRYEGDPDRHRRRDAAARGLRRRHRRANSPDHRPDPRRRHPAAVGVLEAMARAARSARQEKPSTTCRRDRRHAADGRLRRRDEAADPGNDARRGRRSATPSSRSSSPTFRCRSTTCWRLPASPASTDLGAGRRVDAVGRLHGRGRRADRRAAEAVPLDQLRRPRIIVYVAGKMIWDGTHEVVRRQMATSCDGMADRDAAARRRTRPR